MRARERLALIAVLFLAAVFVFTVTRSVLRRAETSYAYPSYSSLNNGEGGTRAYFQALRRLGYTPSRNYQPLHKLAGTQSDIFYAGTALAAFRYFDLAAFELLANRGARLIFALDSNGTVQNTPKSSKQKLSTTQGPEDALKKRWGIELAFVKRDVSKEWVTWRFSSWTKNWVPSQVRDGSPLFLERHFGKGSILLIASSKLFTNRQLLIKPDTQALAAVLGPRREVIFDESHLGLEDTGTVVGLATAHGLTWLLLGFVMLAVLYVWRNSISFLPPLPSRPDAAVSGRDAYSALSNLLRQTVPPKSILGVAAAEWNMSVVAQRGRILGKDELDRLKHVEPARVPAEYSSLARRLTSKSGELI